MNLGDTLKKILMLIFSACFILSSCEIRMITPADTEETLPVIATTTGDVIPDSEPQPYPVIINDTVIEKAPEHVISLSPTLTELICEMGYGDKIIGKGSYCDYPPEIQTAADVGTPSKPDLNAIIALSPEILFTATVIPHKDMLALEEAGVKTVYIPNPRSINEFKSIYTALGVIFNGIFDGEAAGEKYYEKVEAAVSAEISLGSFIYITEGLTLATGDTFESSFLSQYGINIAAEGTDYSYPKEYLTELQPEIILLNNNYTIDDLLADEIYSQLDAVANGKVYCITNTYFERPSGRISALTDELGSINQ